MKALDLRVRGDDGDASFFIPASGFA